MQQELIYQKERSLKDETIHTNTFSPSLKSFHLSLHSQQQSYSRELLNHQNLMNSDILTGRSSKDNLEKRFSQPSHQITKESQIKELNDQNQILQSSPPPHRNEFHNQQDILDVKFKLRKIFQFYTTFGDRCNAYHLKSNRFHKMMMDANINNSNITPKQLDLLFVTENKHTLNIDFDAFVLLLRKIAVIKYNDQYNEIQSLNFLLRDYILPLYDEIYNQNQMGLEEERLHEPIEENIINILEYIHMPLKKIFQAYFPWEFQTSQPRNVLKQRSENELFVYLKEFDICPTLIAKSSIYTLWNDILDTNSHKLTYNPNLLSIIPFLDRDYGTVFSFSKFCTLLVRCAIIAYDNQIHPSNRKLSNAEKFILLLERMELSYGMINFEIKTITTYNSKCSLIIPKEVLRKVCYLHNSLVLI